MSDVVVLPDVADDWVAAMRRGDWEAAWRATDRIELPRRARQRRPGFERRLGELRWDGTPPAGRVVMVRCEHGLGDTLQFLRLVPHLRARHVHLMVQPPLVDLLYGGPGLGDVRNYWAEAPEPAHEVDMEVMELAYALRLRLPDLPPPYPHLAAQVAAPQALRLADDGRLRVALLWSASDWDGSRSAPLPALGPLFALDGIRFFSLQQGEAAKDPLLEQLPIERLSSRTADLPLAAAAMRQMDLVISIDGMPAHLAGTLGRPTWLLLKHRADWRWMERREDTPWYPSMRLFRQGRDGDWTGLLQRVALELRTFRSATPAAPSLLPSTAR